ncbi:MAG: flagellar hook-length control protein FliK [Burkholderiales bacterium]|nr:flagellar hook-length control protein FliK [Burkholderiales bacterium]
MNPSTVLPVAPAKAAEIAGPPTSGAADAPESSQGPAFGDVLESRMQQPSPQDTPSTTAKPAAAANDEVAAPVEPVAGPSITVVDPALLLQLQNQRTVSIDGTTMANRVMAADATALPSAEDRDLLELATRMTDRPSPRPGVGESERDARNIDREGGDTRPSLQIAAEPLFARPIDGTDGKLPEDIRVASPRSADTVSEIRSAGPSHGAAAAAEAASATPVRDAAPVRAAVSVPVQAQGWGEAFSERVVWVTQGQKPSAELQLNPPSLGPVDVRVQVGGGETSLAFFSPHASVREAIQQALPRLQEAFAASGINLGDVSVGAQSQQSAGESSQQSRGHGGGEGRAVAGIVPPGVMVSRIHSGSLGSVDVFA